MMNASMIDGTRYRDVVPGARRMLRLLSSSWSSGWSSMAHRRWRATLAAAACAAASCAVVACGGSDGGSPDAATPDAAAPDASPDPPPDAAPPVPDAGAGNPDAAPDVPPEPPEDGDPYTFSAVLRVVDEARAPIAGAMVDTGASVEISDERGYVVLAHHRDPVVVVISGPGLLAQPVVVGHAQGGQLVEVAMRSDAGGARWSMHVAGDVMLARRYYAAQGDMPPWIDARDIAGGARRVVAPVARAFAAADVGTVNLETVVSTLPDSDAYPQKRIVINSHPDTLAALEAMGVDLVMLGNNHARDYLDQGVVETMEALDDWDIPHVGAAADGNEPAQAPYIIEAGQVRVGVLSYTTLTGDGNNDRLAEDADIVPPDLDPDDAWEYEAREWGFTGTVLDVPLALRRAGSAWRLFRDAELAMSPTEAAAAWESLYAVYPELQDGVARRGHGGPALWVTSLATADIAALRQDVDVVIVQVHGSFEFQHAPSRSTMELTRAAVDAGADAVIVHHPHILQGFDWYKGKLIAYSLGNFIFDQEEHSTSPTGFLRLEWDGTRLIEARLVPLDLGNYRPNPVADGISERHLLTLWEKSALGAFVDRDDGNQVRMLLRDPDPDTQLGQIRMQHAHAIVTDAAPAAQTVRVGVPAGAIVAVPVPGLLHARAGGASLQIGRELLGWGDLEDHVADDASTHVMHWNLSHIAASLVVGSDAGSGSGYFTLRRLASNQSDASAFTTARIPVPEHRWFYDEGSGGVPADGAPSYTIHLRGRMNGAGSAYLRLDLYPTEGLLPDPGKLGELAFELAVAADGQWHELTLDVPASGLLVDGERMEAIRANFRLRPPAAGEAIFAVDDVRIMEWRPAADMADRFGAYTHLRNPGAVDVTADLQVLPLRDPQAP
jgi:poly-gamma-glutamate capsule biosynthesis protein CapA/YwtB (metallophosphatase superfamily)